MQILGKVKGRSLEEGIQHRKTFKNMGVNPEAKPSMSTSRRWAIARTCEGFVRFPELWTQIYWNYNSRPITSDCELQELVSRITFLASHWSRTWKRQKGSFFCWITLNKRHQSLFSRYYTFCKCIRMNERRRTIWCCLYGVKNNIKIKVP